MQARTAELDAVNEQLCISEERYALALEATSDGLWDWNIGSGELYCSPAYYRMLGYAPGELAPNQNASGFGLIHPDDRERVTTSFSPANDATGQPRNRIPLNGKKRGTCLGAQPGQGGFKNALQAIRNVASASTPISPAGNTLNLNCAGHRMNRRRFSMQPPRALASSVIARWFVATANWKKFSATPQAR